MTSEQREQLIQLLMQRREAHTLMANGTLFPIVHEGCEKDIAALEPAIDAIISERTSSASRRADGDQ